MRMLVEEALGTKRKGQLRRGSLSVVDEDRLVWPGLLHAENFKCSVYLLSAANGFLCSFLMRATIE